MATHIGHSVRIELTIVIVNQTSLLTITLHKIIQFLLVDDNECKNGLFYAFQNPSTICKTDIVIIKLTIDQERFSF